MLIIFRRLAANDSSPLPHQPPPLPARSLPALPAQPLQPPIPSSAPPGRAPCPLSLQRIQDMGKSQNCPPPDGNLPPQQPGADLHLQPAPTRGTPTCTPCPPPRTAACLALPVHGFGAWCWIAPIPAGTPIPRGLGSMPPLIPGTLGTCSSSGVTPQHPPACCAWMSLLCTASADSISVRLVWIIWGQEGQREVLSTPPAPHIPPHAPCLRSKWGEKRGWEGVGWGSPWHGAARCGAASAWQAARSPCNTKEGSGSGLRLLMGFLPPWAAPQDAPRARWGLRGPRFVGSQVCGVPRGISQLVPPLPCDGSSDFGGTPSRGRPMRTAVGEAGWSYWCFWCCWCHRPPGASPCRCLPSRRQ